MRELIEKLGRRWIEFNYKEIIHMKICDDPALIDYITNPTAIYDHLKIKFIDKLAGHALFAKNDIPENTVIGILTGDILINVQTREASHSGQTIKDEQGNYTIIDSHAGGNQTHFIQHLPSKEILAKYTFAADLKHADVAISNLKVCDIMTKDGLSLTYFKTIRRIAQEEILGCPYETAEGERTMDGLYFFKKQGEILTHSTSCIYPTSKIDECVDELTELQHSSVDAHYTFQEQEIPTHLSTTPTAEPLAETIGVRKFEGQESKEFKATTHSASMKTKKRDEYKPEEAELTEDELELLQACSEETISQDNLRLSAPPPALSVFTPLQGATLIGSEGCKVPTAHRTKS